MRCVCAVMHGYETCQPVDDKGCLLEEGHEGPHEFEDPKGQRWLWETDMECDCEVCSLGEGDYCTIYWRKPESSGS